MTVADRAWILICATIAGSIAYPETGSHVVGLLFALLLGLILLIEAAVTKKKGGAQKESQAPL